MNNLNSNSPINGVHCVVNACVYHTKDNECLAGKITVGGHSADSKNETDCETFSKKDCCN